MTKELERRKKEIGDISEERRSSQKEKEDLKRERTALVQERTKRERSIRSQVDKWVQCVPDAPRVSCSSTQTDKLTGEGKREAEYKLEEKARGTPLAPTETIDKIMADWSLYEDLSDYEKEVEGVAPVTSPVTKKPAARRPAARLAALKPQVANTKTTKVIQKIKAFVVHGIPCSRPMAGTIQEVKDAGVVGVAGARWLLGGRRRAGKATSSVVICLLRRGIVNRNGTLQESRNCGPCTSVIVRKKMSPPTDGEHGGPSWSHLSNACPPRTYKDTNTQSFRYPSL